MSTSCVSVELAKELKRRGLSWRPARFDFFHIPDRNLVDDVFVVADFTVDVQVLADGIAAITFNGAVEWSLDYILQQEVVWLPTEAQLRALLGERLLGLEAVAGGFACRARIDGEVRSFAAPTAPDAYARAVLATL